MTINSTTSNQNKMLRLLNNIYQRDIFSNSIVSYYIYIYIQPKPNTNVHDVDHQQWNG